MARARARLRRRERRDKLVRRRRTARFAGLGLLCIVVGGAMGAYLGRGGVSDARLAAQVTVALDGGPGAGPGHAARAVDNDRPATVVARAAAQSARETRQAAPGRAGEPPLVTAAGPGPYATAADTAAAVQFANLPAAGPGRTAPDSQPWQRHAVQIADPGTRPMIAVVLDDLGLNRLGAYRAIALPAPLTLSFMTYAEDLDRMTAAARGAGHELLLHVPMEPHDELEDPGPNVLRTGLPPDELRRRLEWGFGRFEGFVGINNHMGSKFTASPDDLVQVMGELKARGLLFLDSLTAPASIGAAMARQAGVPYAQRDVFLDNDPRDIESIYRQLAQLETVARRRGYAVGIGHPHRATLDALAIWLPEMRRRGFALVPISAIVRHRIGIAQDRASPTG
ncbi:MAG: divergent polysaccharide deacetylase family protein [Kiloniellaceae bacterium]